MAQEPSKQIGRKRCFKDIMNEKKALSNSSSCSGIVDLDQKAVRKVSKEDLMSRFWTCWNAAEADNPGHPAVSYELLTKWMFMVRDVRGGKGEKAIFQILINNLAKHKHTQAILNHDDRFLEWILEYGYGKDFDYVFGTPLEGRAIKFMARQLRADLDTAKEKGSISMLAKWVPSAKSGRNKEHRIHDKIAAELFDDGKADKGTLRAKMRKEVLSPLRKYLGNAIAEPYLCQKRLGELDLSKVPSQAMKRYKKSFEKKHPKYQEWIAKVESGEAKVNAKAMHPHELVHECMKEGYKENRVSEAQFKVFVDSARESRCLDKTLFLCDTSGSMSGQPMEVCVTLGILSALANTHPNFRRQLITFETNPQFITIPEEMTKMHQIAAFLMDRGKFPWGGSTNFQAVFDQLLRTATACNLTQEEMPDTLVVVSDMQFDCADRSASKTNFEEVQRKYAEAGYEMPLMIFWNVRAGTTDFPVQADDRGVIMISGFAFTILEALMGGELPDIVTPEIMLLTLLNKERYSRVQLRGIPGLTFPEPQEEAMEVDADADTKRARTGPGPDSPTTDKANDEKADAEMEEAKPLDED